MKRWQVLARHNWVSGCTITESMNTMDSTIRRFTATILGFNNWRIYEGNIRSIDVKVIRQRVQEIRNRIEANDESVFHENVTIAS